MENKEAIEWLKGSVVSYEVDNKGKPNGNITCDLTQEVLDMAISALEKQSRIITVTDAEGGLLASISDKDIIEENGVHVIISEE